MTLPESSFFYCITDSHHLWHPFTIQTPKETIQVGSGKKIITISLATASGLLSGGLAALPTLLVSSAFSKKWEIRERRNWDIRVVPPPKLGIMARLYNEGNTCWLNAAMKFIASSNFFDFIFEARNEPNQEDKFQIALLRHYLITIRTRKLSNEILRLGSLVEKAKKLMLSQDSSSESDIEMDATEFVYCLTRFMKVDFQDTHLFKSMMVYENTEHEPKFETPEAIIKIRISFDETMDTQTKLDLASAILRGDTKEFIEDDQDTPTICQAKRYPLNLPEELIIHFSRLVIDENQTLEYSEKPIDLVDQAGQFEMIAYNPKHQEGKWTLHPYKKGLYQFTGAILHWDLKNGGHYTAIERDEKNRYIHHDDTDLCIHKAEKAFMECESRVVLLRFKKIGEEFIN